MTRKHRSVVKYSDLILWRKKATEKADECLDLIEKQRKP